MTLLGFLKRWEVAVSTDHGPVVESRHFFHGGAKAQALVRDQIAAGGSLPTPRRRYARRRS